MIIKEYTIGITTFSNRLADVIKLVEQIRQHSDVDIILSINANFNEDFNEEYRVNILNLCLKYKSIYPIFFPVQRGLSKLWNSLIIHSKTDWVLLLNDDIEITSIDFFKTLENNLKNQEPDICRINGTFSHFLIHKKIINELGWFDERLLGFGEEDGDIIYRYVDLYNKNVTELTNNSIISFNSWVRDEKIRPGVSKYSAFNREFVFLNENPKYIKSTNELGIEGMFGAKYIKNIDDIIQYPYEDFFNKNKENL